MVFGAYDGVEFKIHTKNACLIVIFMLYTGAYLKDKIINIVVKLHMYSFS